MVKRLIVTFGVMVAIIASASQRTLHCAEQFRIVEWLG
jgi:hypothetical protein